VKSGFHNLFAFPPPFSSEQEEDQRNLRKIADLNIISLSLQKGRDERKTVKVQLFWTEQQSPHRKSEYTPC